MLQRVLSPVVDIRQEEAPTALLMFTYSFLAMTSYNIIQPLTRSKLISSLGAVNVPWVILGSGLLMGVIMLGYTRAVSILPKRWALPIILGVMSVVMIGFWALFTNGGDWIPVLFYLWGNLLGILLISQFWTLANGIYDPRQAKRLFGFIGGGVSLGGITGAGLTALLVETVGTNRLLLGSGFTLLLAVVVVSLILGREQQAAPSATAGAEEERGVSIKRAIALLRGSRQIQLIAVVIAFGSLGAAFFDQQLNMVSEIMKGAGQGDSIGAFLAKVRVAVSVVGFVLQVWVTPRIHRYLGIGFALLMLPTNLACMAGAIVFTRLLWLPAAASTTDRSLRYTVDKTTREVLFLPLPSELRQEVKPFVDVTVDRMSRGFGALMLLILTQPWALTAVGLRPLAWYELSYVSMAVAAVWFVMALRAKREYLLSFRRSLETQGMEVRQVRLNVADLSTIETLVQELAQPDPARVVYAIDMLESLDKRNLVTPLLLYHEASAVRQRALQALGAIRSDIAVQWLPQIRRLLADPDHAVRAAAIGAMSAISNADAATLARPLLDDADPRIRATAAIALAASPSPADVDLAEATLAQVAGDSRDSARQARRDVATAVRQIAQPRFGRLLIPLLYDPAPEVADEAIESVTSAGVSDFVFVPTLISLLRDRHLKAKARVVLVGYGEPVIDALAHFLRDPDENIWVRRHLPATIAQIPSQKSVDVLVGALEEEDGFLRYKVVSALARLRRGDTPLVIPHDPIEAQALREARHFFNYLSLYDNVFERGALPKGSLLERALQQKMDRAKDRIYGLLALLYPWRDIAAARWTLEHGEGRTRAAASEYLDNILGGRLRKSVMPILEDLPHAERVRIGNVMLRTRPRDLEETLLQLINDDDQVIAASAIDVVRQHKVWTLAPDVEHVLAHRDVRDWYVFESASWALAEQRMPVERRRELWHEPLPAAELAERLRPLPLFASVTVDELFRIASASRQLRHEAATVLLQEGAVPDTIHLLLDGSLSATGSKSASRTVESPAAVGFVEALQGLPMAETLRTTGIAVTLAIGNDELRTLLADNTELVRGLFATLADRVDEPNRHPVQATGAALKFEQLSQDGLLPVEKILVMQRVPVFSRVSVDEMQHLAHIAHEVHMAPGTQLFIESSPPALWLVLAGEVQLHDREDGSRMAAGAGDTIGTITTMSGRGLDLSADVVRPGLALRIESADLFQMLGDRPELLREMFAGMFRLEGSALPGFRL